MDHDLHTSRFSLQHRWGGGEDAFSIDQLTDLLDELDADDPEHPDVWISDNEVGYSVLAFAGSRGLVVLEDHEEVRGPRHMTGYSMAMMRNLFEMVMQGRVSEVESLPWLPGYGS
ncbi:hypothetical protein [Actinoplanes aureus]|uniref:Uncharacterized protein n=1 Tax=Actinoplanes aureus TaxID=2792083 RepID=A0A931CLN6_9ACTN|nr:hypothetical protein [Actinoplanes aureus]MBG0568691.1 hypothetical protein [Actinoplanes aureus]